LAATVHAAEQIVGERPYEMVWASRTQDDHPPLVDFEDLDGWTVETVNSVASFERSREQQIWDQQVGKLTYRYERDEAQTSSSPVVRIVPPAPIAIGEPFDAVSLWVYGNNWSTRRDLTTPPVSITAFFADSEGNPFGVYLTRVGWEEWFLCYRRLTPEQIEGVKGGAAFLYLTIENGRNEADRTIYMDNLAIFTEEFPPLSFEPRRMRGIDMFPGQGVGTNTGPGRLPFPTREQTILPDDLAGGFKTSVQVNQDGATLTYQGADGTLTYTVTGRTGTWGDITARWEGRGEPFRPCVDGGVHLQTADGPKAPNKFKLLATEWLDDGALMRWRVSSGDVSGEVSYTYRIWGKSLVIETACPGGVVGEVRYGHAEGLGNPRLVTNPYYHYNRWGRPAVVVSGPPDAPLLLAGNTDWYLSNAALPFAENEVKDGQVRYNGGTRYIANTDGALNDCFERFFITVSPRYEEVLPDIPNPVSPWKQITGTRLWRAHGAGNRDNDRKYWFDVQRHGITEMVVTDHETMWRDGGESFTFRTMAAPGKGGDQGAYDYARFMQDELGFVYGPYNNYTDFAPVNSFWSVDRVNRMPDNQLQGAWMRCYAPKPAFAVEACELLAPQIEDKFHFSTAYCDVHTAVAPWDRVDYDYRVPGAGTFEAVFYSYGEIMLLQKQAWDGPVYSEGNMHWMYCGLTDGNYAQDRGYDLVNNPWLVDFDLRKMHPLCCNFGMGATSMFYGRDTSLGRTRQEIDASIDRFLAATVAFGHPGFLVGDGGFQNALRSYYMLQQLHSRYCLADAAEILYADAAGKLHDTTAAVANGCYQRSQVVTRYDDGTVTAVNGDQTERMRVQAFGHEADLPPNGYAGWTSDRQVEVISGDEPGHRCDYAVTPAYLYADGRGSFTRLARAASNGPSACRVLGEGQWEVIPYQGAECGFDVDAVSAAALDHERNELGPADVRRARGLTYVVPVEGAFSYLLRAGEPAADLACDRDQVVPGERVVVRGAQEHELRIPPDASAGDRIWEQLEGKWIDFTVLPLAYADASLEGNTLKLSLRSNLPAAEDFTLGLDDQTRPLRLVPGTPGTVEFDLGEPAGEESKYLQVSLRAGDATAGLEYGVLTIKGQVPVAELPSHYTTGMALRGQDETTDFGTSKGSVGLSSRTCGGIAREGFTMHPPYSGGVGYVHVLYDPVTLPAEPPAALRAWVGKGDGSDLGDGILYKVMVVEEDGTETVAGTQLAAKHEWLTLEGDLSPWAGKTVRIKLIADVGEGDNSSGDWACLADPRVETLETMLVRTLDEDVATYRREPGPFPVEGLTVEQMRGARQAWLHYDGIGLSGTGEAYGSFAILNGEKLGNMAGAGGGERENVWAENCTVAL
ncbi:MAG TPA: hypothetical protein VM283_05045, partial [Armatimonadota bacterium]|nr:hypothetical protein [Armatimonadota bacterium]